MGKVLMPAFFLRLRRSQALTFLNKLRTVPELPFLAHRGDLAHDLEAGTISVAQARGQRALQTLKAFILHSSASSGVGTKLGTVKFEGPKWLSRWNTPCPSHGYAQSLSAD